MSNPTPGQIAYAAWHGISVEHATQEEWPDSDRMVRKWELVGAAVVAAVRQGKVTTPNDAPGGRLAPTPRP